MTANDLDVRVGDIVVLKDSGQEVLVIALEYPGVRVYNQDDHFTWRVSKDKIYPSPDLLGKEGDGEVIITDPGTGGAKGQKDCQINLIPADVLWELGEHYGKGVAKYPPGQDGVDNWRKGYKWSLSFAAALRHLNQALQGIDYDEESGSKHVLSAVWHLMTIAHYMNREDLQYLDDRQATLVEKMLKEKKND